jgi:hypothetical protein
MGESCGAKTRNGGVCKKAPIKNKARCRLHGGESDGPPKGNQNALKHGIYSSVLSDEEKELWDSVELGAVGQELRLCRLRLMRTIRAENEAQGEPELEEHVERDGGGEATVPNERKYKRRDYASTVDRLMGRIESLEKTRAALIESGGGADDDLDGFEVVEYGD